MQWIFMLAGLVLGAASDESLSGAIFGGLIGLAIGQAIKVHGLEWQNSVLRKELQAFAERFEQGTSAIHQRLLKVEAGLGSAPAPAPAQPAPAEVKVAVAASAAAEVDDGLVWELPELQPQLNAAADDSELVWELPPIMPRQPAPVVAPAAVARSAPRIITPAEPNWFERAFTLARNWLFGGNTVLRVGVLLLFLGLAFLLRYATEGMVVPVQVRYAGVAATAVALLGLGWWLRLRNANYGLMLQGTGIAVLYLTVFAAMRLHPLLSSTEALSLLVVITLCSAILAVAQDALGLAAAAALGGFAAPILTSTGAGNHVALFSYFILLNTGIFAIAWFKAWRLLNLIGFVGTFGIG
ncbi:MAG: DUF2339 domain-containing protein, partial [Pseudomonas sp.]|uniref:DUF2339 domain-containing protein n=1 Tax=Pseudomonas sp. TaxID=306 RepID=UPI003BB719C8